MRFLVPAGALFLASSAPSLAQFAAPSDLTSTSNLALGVIAEDVDGDGLADVLATASFDRAISLFPGRGDGTFGERQILVALDFAPQLVGQADLDGDGDQDVLVAGIDGDVVFIERLDGETLAAPIPVGAAIANPLDLVLEDMDLDGDTDAIVANGDGVFLIENLGGLFGAPRDLVPFEDALITSASVGDFDGDLDPDLVLTLSGASASTGLYRNNGANFGPREDITVFGVPYDPRPGVGDVDADGDLDLVQNLALPNRLSTLLNDGTGSFSLGALLPAPQSSGPEVVEDLDGDGVVDLVILPVPFASFDTPIHAARGLGGGTFADPTAISPPLPEIRNASALGDLDGDGLVDFVGSGQLDDSTSRIFATLNASSVGSLAFSESIDVTTAVREPFGVRLADLDSDGAQDAIVLSRLGDESRWMRGDGLGNFVDSGLLPIDLDFVHDVRFADFDGDEVIDLVGRGDRTGLVVSRGLGGGRFDVPLALNPPNMPAPFGLWDVLVVDLDQDGRDDIVTGIQTSLHYYRNLGSFTWAPPTVLPSVRVTRQFAAGDLDDNGSIDLLVTGDGGPYVIYDPVTPASRVEEVDFTLAPSASPVLADVDRDGSLDPVFLSVNPTNDLRSVLYYLPNNPAAIQVARRVTGLEASGSEIAFVDVDGDGLDDVLQSDELGNLRWSRRDGSFYRLELDVFAEGIRGLTVADIDEDGDDDLFVTMPLNSAASWLESETFDLIGTRYCGPAIPNSTGAPSRIEAIGSRSVEANRVTLVAVDLPPLSFGYFLVGPNPDVVFPVPGSDGRLCLGAPVGRYVASGQIQQSDATGRFSLDIDLTAIPSPSGPVATVPGSVWRFQAWHRDVGATGVTSNFSDALTIVFQ
ncbi:MAG: VCBS repeat-containing protein [Planctomycetota bacterium]